MSFYHVAERKAQEGAQEFKCTLYVVDVNGNYSVHTKKPEIGKVVYTVTHEQACEILAQPPMPRKREKCGPFDI